MAFEHLTYRNMATDRINPAPDQPGPQAVKAQAAADAQVLKEQQIQRRNRALRIVSAAQVVIALAVVLAICYVAKLLLVTLLISVLLAFMLEPVVNLLERVRLPRSVGSIVAVILLLAVVYAGMYFFYNRALDFAHQLPRYSQQIRSKIAPMLQKASQFQQTTEKVLPQQNDQGKKAMPVMIQNSKTDGLTQNIAVFTEVALTLAFIPFLVYFMLSWQEHARTKTVQLFPAAARTTAYVTLGQISLMMRSFITGNFIIGLFMGIGSMVVFGFLGLPYFYFLGLISGFLSLVPYLGVILAMVPPLAAGLGTLSTTGMIVVAATVLGMHILAMNILYPKVIGSRLQLNPLVVTIGLLVWGFIWGAMGLILAVPVLGTIKIICDHVTPLRPIGAWMGE